MRTKMMIKNLCTIGLLMVIVACAESSDGVVPEELIANQVMQPVAKLVQSDRSVRIAIPKIVKPRIAIPKIVKPRITGGRCKPCKPGTSRNAPYFPRPIPRPIKMDGNRKKPIKKQKCPPMACVAPPFKCPKGSKVGPTKNKNGCPGCPTCLDKNKKPVKVGSCWKAPFACAMRACRRGFKSILVAKAGKNGNAPCCPKYKCVAGPRLKCPKCKCPKCKHYGEELVQTQSSHSCRCKCRACVKRMVRCPVGRPYCRGRKTVKRTYMYHGKKCVKYSCGVALKIESHTRRMDGNRRKIRRKYKKKTFKALKREKKVAQKRRKEVKVAQKRRKEVKVAQKRRKEVRRTLKRLLKREKKVAQQRRKEVRKKGEFEEMLEEGACPPCRPIHVQKCPPMACMAPPFKCPKGSKVGPTKNKNGCPGCPACLDKNKKPVKVGSCWKAPFACAMRKCMKGFKSILVAKAGKNGDAPCCPKHKCVALKKNQVPCPVAVCHPGPGCKFLPMTKAEQAAKRADGCPKFMCPPRRKCCPPMACMAPPFKCPKGSKVGPTKNKNGCRGCPACLDKNKKPVKVGSCWKAPFACAMRRCMKGFKTVVVAKAGKNGNAPCCPKHKCVALKKKPTTKPSKWTEKKVKAFERAIRKMWARKRAAKKRAAERVAKAEEWARLADEEEWGDGDGYGDGDGDGDEEPEPVMRTRRV